MTTKPYAGWSILIDCDGTLTDGKKHIDIMGERELISFHARDSVACKMLVEMGFQVIIITHSKFKGIRDYWEKYDAVVACPNEGDPMTNKLLVETRFAIDWNKTIGIGDDITDNCFLQKCKYPYIVADAHPFYMSKELELWLGRSVYLGGGKPGSPKKLPCKGGDGVLSYIYQLIQLGVYD